MLTACVFAGLHPAAPALALEAAKIYEMRAPSIWVVRVFDAQDHPTRLGSAVVIGAAQSLALLAGISREGVVLVGGLLWGAAYAPYVIGAALLIGLVSMRFRRP